jgi:phospholipid transport system substrate-binding protein
MRTVTRLLMPALASALLFCALCGAPALAASEARQELEKTINEVLTELKKPELKNPATKQAVLSQVESIIRRLFSFEELSMRTVGPEWKNMTPDQRNRFMTAFETLLRESYLEKLDGYNGETVKYTGETASSKGDKVEIKTTVDIKGKPVPVNYRMIKKDRWVVYDVIIEEVSMVQNYRSQFQGIIAKEGAERLIELVKAKADEARVRKPA